MSETVKNLGNIALDSCIVYRKNGIIEEIHPPEYGEVILKFQDNRLMFIEKRELKKV